MPWETKDIMSLREEFVCLAKQEGANRRELCRRFGISPQTAYKWLARFSEEGVSGWKTDPVVRIIAPPLRLPTCRQP